MYTQSRGICCSALVLTVAALLCAMHGAVAQDVPAGTPPDPGFVSIFNGKDLTGWEGAPGVWSVKDGAIRCESPADGKRGWLIWRGGEPEDFELRLSFRYFAGNSGVQVRSKEIEPLQVCGYQVEVAAQEAMGLWHHSIAPAKERAELATAGQRVHIKPDGEHVVEQIAPAEEVQKAYRQDGWNELRIIASGTKLVQEINGVVFAELIDEETAYATRKGVIAFQDHGKGTVAEFKDVRLKVME